MGVFGGIAKAAKFVVVSLPMQVLGAGQIRRNNSLIASLWRNLHNPVCPECQKAVLEPVGSEDGAWSCKNCRFTVADRNGIAAVREAAKGRRNELVRTMYAATDQDERKDIARRHRLVSRCCFAGAAFTVCGFLYYVATGASVILALNWLAFALVCWTHGMKRSYRSWQVLNGQLFVEGAFWVWLKEERWLV
ncbi:hypothetical protein [Tahibacter amnicola]|uniref:Uncharacterized protein n=1 Tax=Tahibacter amnicola TaxID=2976241 RepID=A0ABY6BE77_9GAMM|nr:hypothetical protein [Tahibacter amnicola]UXI68328.1 hypothetical protein N4264_01370 [Tahibacter amnicola]